MLFHGSFLPFNTELLVQRFIFFVFHTVFAVEFRHLRDGFCYTAAYRSARPYLHHVRQRHFGGFRHNLQLMAADVGG